MGVKVLPELVDAEILNLINKINEFSFLQSRSSCSGWTNLEDGDGASDGVHRKWFGSPYISMWSLDNAKAVGVFLPFLMKHLIFDYSDPKKDELIDEFHKKLASVGLEDDSRQLIHVGLEYRNEKVVINIYIYDKDRTPEQVEKIFKFIDIILDNFKAKF
jgi:hypothetical protein